MKRYQGEDWRNFIKSSKKLEISQYTKSLNNNICIFINELVKDQSESEVFMHWLSDKEKEMFLQNIKNLKTNIVSTKDNKKFYVFEKTLMLKEVFNYKK